MLQTSNVHSSARLNSLTPFFDSLQKWGANESTNKPKLVELSRIQKDFKVLDLGCGTATLTILVKKNYPSTKVSAIDIDPGVLKIAKEKATEANVKIAFDLGTVFNLPYPNNHFDRILSSWVFHHLTRENKVRTLREAFRVLKPNGELHVVYLCKPQNPLMRMLTLIMGHLEESEDNVKCLLTRMFRTAGFE